MTDLGLGICFLFTGWLSIFSYSIGGLISVWITAIVSFVAAVLFILRTSVLSVIIRGLFINRITGLSFGICLSFDEFAIRIASARVIIISWDSGFSLAFRVHENGHQRCDPISCSHGARLMRA